MSMDRKIAALVVGVRQTPYFLIPFFVLMPTVYLLAPQAWLMQPRHFAEIYWAIFALLLVAGVAWMYPRSKFRPPSEERLSVIMANPALHFTKHSKIQSMLDDAAKMGQPGHYHLKPTSDFSSMWKLYGYGTYCFSGWPSKKELYFAVGCPDCVVIIKPSDVPPGGILARKIDGAILLNGGYTGPARVVMLADLEEKVFAQA